MSLLPSLDDWPVLRRELWRTARSRWSFFARYPAVLLLACACFTAEPPQQAGLRTVVFGGISVSVPQQWVNPGFGPGLVELTPSQLRRAVAEDTAATAYVAVQSF